MFMSYRSCYNVDSFVMIINIFYCLFIFFKNKDFFYLEKKLIVDSIFLEIIFLICL